MIYVRDDDVLVNTENFKDPFGRFRGIHNIIKERNAIHRVGIVVESIKGRSDITRYIRDEFEAGTMHPHFHGIEHINYASMDRRQIVGVIRDAQRFWCDNFGTRFLFFYTPWGADSSEIRQACSEEGIIFRDCKHEFYPIEDVSRDPEASYEKYNDKEIFIHWWAKGAKRLMRVLDRLQEK